MKIASLARSLAGVAESLAPAAGPGPVHGNVSVGGLGWQPHLSRRVVYTRPRTGKLKSSD